jgi:tRNA A-37 threonylcarbamoyl transferase component Bud32
MSKPPRSHVMPPSLQTIVQKKTDQTAIRQAGTKITAPPAYRPQPVPKVLQRKPAVGRQPPRTPSAHRPIAPPVYSPQPVPKVLQTKTAHAQQARVEQVRRQTAAPPVYRPQPVQKVLQAKTAAPQQAATQQSRAPVAPPVYRPQPLPRVLQMKKAGGGQALTGKPPRQAVAPPVHRYEPARVLQLNEDVRACRVHREGIHDRVRACAENSSGKFVHEAKVHDQFPGRVQLKASPETNGTDLHVDSGQTSHPTHQSSAVAQQKQGTVKPAINSAVGGHGLTPRIKFPLVPGNSAHSTVQMFWGYVGFVLGAAALLGAKKLYDVNSIPEISETQNLLDRINKSPSDKDLTILSNQFFSSKIRPLGMIHFRWNNIVKQVRPIVEKYVMTRINPKRLTEDQRKMLEIAETSPEATKEVKAKAMKILAGTATVWQQAPDMKYRIEDFIDEYVNNVSEIKASELTNRIYDFSQQGPIRISSKGARPFKNEKESLQNYDLEKVIGKGISGNVALAQHKGRNVVVKKIKVQNPAQLQKILRETAIQMDLNAGDRKSDTKSYAVAHKAIVVGDTVYIIMEAADSNWDSTLKENPPALKELLLSLKKLADGYKHMHSRGYLHKDIKPENVLVKDNDLFISDFGETLTHAEDTSADSKLFGRMIFDLLKEYSTSLGLSGVELATLKSFEGMTGLSLHCASTVQVPGDTTVHKLIRLAQKMFLQKMNMKQCKAELDTLILQA